MRRTTRTIELGDVKIGSGHPVSVQTMTKTDTRDIVSTINQIKEVEEAGCQIVRCAVPDLDAAKALKKIIKSVKIPVIADIHFDHKLALESIKSGIHGLRINPGNIGSKSKI
ncbi:MAG TPA: 4-hydroxy-3-methylbut-2-en-1-yl diphosphate synthase, partial [Candidatus Dadabacteria bacterium]|nr:4-hydroxy-3-methylbut-2-en-1-yl diphosphate synthase [Candidatus Dadabacteria bacterium]